MGEGNLFQEVSGFLAVFRHKVWQHSSALTSSFILSTGRWITV